MTCFLAGEVDGVSDACGVIGFMAEAYLISLLISSQNGWTNGNYFYHDIQDCLVCWWFVSL